MYTIFSLDLDIRIEISQKENFPVISGIMLRLANLFVNVILCFTISKEYIIKHNVLIDSRYLEVVNTSSIHVAITNNRRCMLY